MKRPQHAAAEYGDAVVYLDAGLEVFARRAVVGSGVWVDVKIGGHFYPAATVKAAGDADVRTVAEQAVASLRDRGIL